MDDPTEVSEASGQDKRTLKEFARESVTMALYLSLSLLAVLLAIPADSLNGKNPVGVLLMTAIGLLVAHLLASAIASRLVSGGVLDAESRATFAAQILAGVVVTLLMLLPMLFVHPPGSFWLSEGLLLAFVCWVGYVAARQAEKSALRAWAYVAAVFLSVVLVLVVKSFAEH